MNLWELGQQWYQSEYDKVTCAIDVKGQVAAMDKHAGLRDAFRDAVKGKSILIDFERKLKFVNQNERKRNGKIIQQAVMSGAKVRWLMQPLFDKNNLDHVHDFTLYCNRAGIIIADPFDEIYERKKADEIWCYGGLKTVCSNGEAGAVPKRAVNLFAVDCREDNSTTGQWRGPGKGYCIRQGGQYYGSHD